MGAWQIPLSGPRPQGNPFDAAMRGQQDYLNAQAMMQQQDLRKQQIQGTQLENQQRQLQLNEMNRQNQEQDLLRKAYLDAHGDMNQFFSNAAQSGVRPTTLAPLQKSWVDSQEAYAKLGKAKVDELNTRHDALNGSVMGSFSSVGEDGTRTWRQPAPDEWSRWITSARNNGLLSPQELETVLSAHPLDQPPTADQIQQYSATLNTATQAGKIASQNLKNAETVAGTGEKKANTANKQAQLPGIQAKSDQEERANWASQLAAAPDADTYGAILDKMPHGLAQQVPVAREDFDPDESPKVLQRWGQTSEQQVRSDLANATLEARKQHYGAMETNAQQRTGLEGARVGLERERVDLQRDRQEGGGQTPNSQAVDRREAEREIPKLEAQEAQLNRDRRSLGQQIKQGVGVVKDKNGNDVDPRDLLKDKSDELKRLLANKYDAYRRAGRGAPSVSLEDAQRAVDAGYQDNPAPQQKPQAQQAKPKFTEDEIRRRATAAGRDPDLAVKTAKQKGLI